MAQAPPPNKQPRPPDRCRRLEQCHHLEQCHNQVPLCLRLRLHLHRWVFRRDTTPHLQDIR